MDTIGHTYDANTTDADFVTSRGVFQHHSYSDDAYDGAAQRLAAELRRTHRSGRQLSENQLSKLTD
jgi:hypothetical protein